MRLKTLREITDEAIRARLSYFKNDTRRTALSLGVARRTVYNRMESMGIEPPARIAKLELEQVGEGLPKGQENCLTSSHTQ